MKLEEYDFPPREDADVWFPLTIRYGVILTFICDVVLILLPLFYPEYWLLILIMIPFACSISIWLYLWYRNILLVMRTEHEFVYRTFLGNIYKFRFSEITRIEDGLGGIQIIFSDKKIYIPKDAIISKKFRNKICDEIKRIGNDDGVELPTFSRKSEALQKRFRDR